MRQNVLSMVTSSEGFFKYFPNCPLSFSSIVYDTYHNLVKKTLQERDMAADIYTFKKSRRYRIFEISQILRKAIKNTNTPLIKKIIGTNSTN